jgi:hypothetical protein
MTRRKAKSRAMISSGNGRIMRSLTYRWSRRRRRSRHSLPTGQGGSKIDRSSQNGSAVNWLHKRVRRALGHFFVNSLLCEYHNERLKRELSFGCEAHQWEDSMRILIYLAVAAAMLTLPAQAAHNRGHLHTHPYWQGEPTDRLPIWRYGYYQGNDPDQFIRSQMMRDPVYGPVR